MSNWQCRVQITTPYGTYQQDIKVPDDLLTQLWNDARQDIVTEKVSDAFVQAYSAAHDAKANLHLGNEQ